VEHIPLGLGRHFEYLNALMQRGVVWLAGRTLTTDPASFGIVERP
jgi:hypothetical protein